MSEVLALPPLPSLEDMTRANIIARIREKGTFIDHANGFQLKCGLRSPYLFDLSRCFRTAPWMRYLGGFLEPHLKGVKFVGGQGSGGNMLAAAACSVMDDLSWVEIREQEKHRGRDLGWVTGPVEFGDEVAVVEDVTTSGMSLWGAIHGVEASGLTVNRVIVLLDREEEDLPQVKEIISLYPTKVLLTKKEVLP